MDLFQEKISRLIPSRAKILTPFSFRQMGVSSIEFQALPGPEVRPLCAKTIRHGPLLGPGGQAVLCAKTG
jgi:hypothetical protein